MPCYCIIRHELFTFIAKRYICFLTLQRQYEKHANRARITRSNVFVRSTLQRYYAVEVLGLFVNSYFQALYELLTYLVVLSRFTDN